MDNRMMLSAPPMGWNSWNTFFDQINEELVMETADTMVREGLLAAGYQYLIIDDCWATRQRDAKGALTADPVKFPHGIKAMADYVHGKGLKFGLYSCCGTRTCANYPGSFDHEFSDAAQFARWGVDYLKYDNCFRPNTVPSSLLYRRMSMALRSCGRDIVLAACQWGTEDVHQWIRSSGAHTFRSTPDIQDSWRSIASIATSQMEKQAYSGPGCYNDMDMLVVGMYGKGLNPETSVGGCTDEEYQTHFALWAMMGSPLIIGCDIRTMTDKTKEILTNRDLIAINQDPECRGPYRLSVYGNPDAFVLVKSLSNGEYAIGFFNFSDVAARVSLNFWDMGLSVSSECALRFHDCISHEELGVQREIFAPTVAAHGCQVYRCRIVEDHP
ncbi:MAG: glycoside hydrolase family 27 protein [Clostridiales bacterium]|nr:glycoside hydrolase family 27 protein [Clostridiales bacterium]